MNQYHIRIIFIFFSTFISCKQVEKKSDSDATDFENTVTLESSKIDLSPEYIGHVLDMILIDDFVVIEDIFHRDNVLFIFDTKTKLITRKYCSKGKGPGEVIEPTFNMVYDPFENKIQLFDTNLKKALLYKINKNSEEKLEFLKEYRIDIDELKNEWIRELFKINDWFLATGSGGRFSESRFCILDKDLIPIKFCNNYFEYGDGIPFNHAKSILSFNPSISIKPDQTKLVFCSYIGATLEIFDLTDIPEKIHLDISRNLYSPIYEVNKNAHHVSISWSDKTIIGFEDIYVTDNYIYTLLNESRGDSYSYPNKINVYDWSGNKVVQYILDENICSLAVDEKKEIIYAVTFASVGENQLIEIDMSK